MKIETFDEIMKMRLAELGEIRALIQNEVDDVRERERGTDQLDGIVHSLQMLLKEVRSEGVL